MLVEDLVILPVARGVPAVGRMVMPDQVMRDFAVDVSLAVTVMVMLLVVTTAGYRNLR